jgi:hypothetical protein
MDTNNTSPKENNQPAPQSPEQESSQQPLPLHNPLDENDHRKITQEDIDNEQKFKEALTERD